MEAPVVPTSLRPRGRKRDRRPFQFRLRTALWIMSAVSIGMSCFVTLRRTDPPEDQDSLAEDKWPDVDALKLRETAIEHLAAAERWGTLRRRAETQRPVAERLAALGVEVKYHEATPDSQWLRDLVGEESVLTAISVDFTGRTVPDAASEDLAALSDLRGLYLGGSTIKDDSLASLKGLTQLRVLHLRGSRVTDAGLVHLEGLSQLQVLTLYETGVTDSGLTQLKGLSQLRHLTLPKTITETSKEKLRSALPRLGIDEHPGWDPVIAPDTGEVDFGY